MGSRCKSRIQGSFQNELFTKSFENEMHALELLLLISELGKTRGPQTFFLEERIPAGLGHAHALRMGCHSGRHVHLFPLSLCFGGFVNQNQDLNDKENHDKENGIVNSFKVLQELFILSKHGNGDLLQNTRLCQDKGHNGQESENGQFSKQLFQDNFQILRDRLLERILHVFKGQGGHDQEQGNHDDHLQVDLFKLGFELFFFLLLLVLFFFFAKLLFLLLLGFFFFVDNLRPCLFHQLTHCRGDLLFDLDAR
mmetsp:Transcript_1197/g.2591  ORF Transcript_1197/g.2591 Transcript_1197/m.2591 type:complete len:253 (+) Transcript_1197:1449-2207(+)